MIIGQIKSNSLIQIFIFVMSTVTGFLLSAMLGRNLGPEALGVWAATAALSSIIIGFTGFGTETVVARRIAVDPEQASVWLSNGIGMRFLVSLPLSCLLIMLATMLLNNGSIPIKFALVYSLYAGMASVCVVLNRGCQALQHFIWQLYPLLLGSLPALAATYLWLRNGGDVFGVVVCAATGQVVGTILTALIMRRYVATVPRCLFQVWRSIIAESWPLAVSAPFLAAYARVDSVLLMKMQGAKSVGYYSAVYAFFMAFGGLGASVQSALFPVLARNYAESPEKARLLFKRGLFWMLALGVLGVTVTFLVGRKMLTLVYGSSFEVAGTTFNILMVGSIFLLLNNTYGITISAVGRQKTALIITVVGLISNILVNLILIPRFDFIGAAWATLITEAIVLVMCHFCLAPAWSPRLEPVTEKVVRGRF